ncbi:uncharacterized protein L201_000580 [Kwoniella dendrophila CBS 6074]|uniref:BRCT domain-containing protein n=1 Tax=Kwoniella dendrophila CBS 6074 TaxID=1295534 RepID=A0AAX4JLF5_9TREE
MSPPRLRRQPLSTNQQQQPVRSVLSGVPRTRSMAKLAATNTTTSTITRKSKLTVFDENAIPSTTVQSITAQPIKGLNRSTSTKNLRSRTALKESKSISNLNNMNVLEEEEGDMKIMGGKSIGKRKIIDEKEEYAETKRKVMKMDQNINQTQQQRPPIRKERLVQLKTRSIGHQSSSESLRSLEPPCSTSIPINTPSIPTPARELLKNNNHNTNTTTPTESPTSFSHIVARPPTPPRMKERPPVPKIGTNASAIPMTPQKPKTPSRDRMDIDTSDNKPLSRMPASLRKTPGLSTIAFSLNARPVPSTPSFRGISTTPAVKPTPIAEQDVNTNPASTSSENISTTPKKAPSPGRLLSFPYHAPAQSTTPTGPPPSIKSRMPNTLFTPRMRVVPPSPLANRGTPATEKKDVAQPTLDTFWKQKETLMEVDEKETSIDQETRKLERPIDTQVKTMLAPATLPRPDLTMGKSSTKFNKSPTVEVDTSSHITPPQSSRTEEEQHKVAPTISAASKGIPANTSGSMAPPSRIPVSKPTNITASTSSIPVISKKPSTVLGSLPERRPSTRPSLVPAISASTRPVDEQQHPTLSPSIKRKPSYPSSLGSGPLSRPTQRMVSNPIVNQQSRSSSNPSPTPLNELNELPISGGSSSQRSVSAPMGGHKPRMSLSSSTSTREGLTGETSKSLAGLSDALSKLKARRTESAMSTSSLSNPVGRSDQAKENTPSISITKPLNERPSNLTSNSSRSRQSIHPNHNQGDLSISSDESNNDVGNQSIAALLCSTNGSKCLQGVRAFVDIRTSDGEDSGRLFIDILKGLGARVFAKPTESCTHIIYKSGKPSTLAWYRKHIQELEFNAEEEEKEKMKKPFIVGIKWVTECKKSGKRLDELPFLVDISEEDIFQKRRKSMEPKSLAASQGIGLGQPSTARQSLLDVAQARKRSMQYAPKVPSPLKKGYMGLS